MRARSFGSFVCCGLAAGVVAAAVAFPGAALAGLAVRAASDAYLDLPADLRTPPPAQTSYVYGDDGRTLITTFFDQNRHDVGLADIAIVMQQAIVAAEDTRFYQHGAVDLKSMLRALVSDSRGGGPTQGASTLTMQYVRNVLKSDPTRTAAQRIAATADTPQRKLQEIRYATELERRLSKSEILDRYLNIAYFGDGAYGIDAASETYFSKPPGLLTLPEAALLAGLVQSPDADNPVNGDRTAALARRKYVLDAMTRAGDITTAQAGAAGASPLTLHPSQSRNGCAAVPAATNDWGFFCDLRQWWDAQARFGATVADRERALNEGGYTIVTSLDPGAQAAALRESLSVYGYGEARALPMAVVQPGTGRILAMAVNRHYSLDPNPGGRKYPNTVDQLVAGGGGAVGYPAGSTFKLFTMLAALSDGQPLDTGFDAPSPLLTRWRATGPDTCGGYWCPVNANPSWMDGRRTIWTGYGRSVNTYFVWLEEQVGPRAAVAMAQRLGITFRAAGDAALAAHPDTWGSFTLGVADTTPLDLAAAYATIAANGTYCAPLPIVTVTDASGATVPVGPTCRQAVDPDLAAAATDAARCPVGQQSAYEMCDGGTAPQVSAIMDGRPVAGKTGSAEDNATETFVRFTPQLVAVGIAADPDDPGDRLGVDVASQVDSAVARTLAAALRGQPIRAFSVPSVTVAFG